MSATTDHPFVGSTIYALNRTYSLRPGRPIGPDETVDSVDPYDMTVYTVEGNCHLNGDYGVRVDASREAVVA